MQQAPACHRPDWLHNARKRGSPATCAAAAITLRHPLESGRRGRQSIIESHLEGNKGQGRQFHVGYGGNSLERRRNADMRRLGRQSRPRKLEIGDALLELHAYGAPVAAAIVIGFMSEIRRRKNLESEQKSDPNGGKELPQPPTLTPKSAEPKHIEGYYSISAANFNGALRSCQGAPRLLCTRMWILSIATPATNAGLRPTRMESQGPLLI